MEKLDYFIRRFLLVIPTFLGITLLCFALIQFVPGGPVEQIVQQMKGIGAAESGRGVGVTSSISEEQRKAIETHFGFDKPFYLRYWKWLDRQARYENGVIQISQQNHLAVDKRTI